MKSDNLAAVSQTRTAQLLDVLSQIQPLPDFNTARGLAEAKIERLFKGVVIEPANREHIIELFTKQFLAEMLRAPKPHQSQAQ